MPVVPPKNLTAENLAKMAKEHAAKLSTSVDDDRAKEAEQTLRNLRRRINALTTLDRELSKSGSIDDKVSKRFINSVKNMEFMVQHLYTLGKDLPRELGAPYSFLSGSGKRIETTLHQKDVQKNVQKGILQSERASDKQALVNLRAQAKHQKDVQKGIYQSQREFAKQIALSDKQSLVKLRTQAKSSFTNIEPQWVGGPGGISMLVEADPEVVRLQKDYRTKTIKYLQQQIRNINKNTEKLNISEKGQVIADKVIDAGMWNIIRSRSGSPLLASENAAFEQRFRLLKFQLRGGDRGGKGGVNTAMLFGGMGRFGHHAQNIGGIKKLLMGASIGAVAAGGGGMIGAPLIGALLATALGFPELAPVGALGGVVYDVGKDLWGGAKAINHSMDPFANQAVNLSKAANVMGISFADLVKTYGGSKHALNKISPMFSGLGVMPTDIPSLASAYGMSFRHQRAMRLAAAAPWAPYLGFQGPHEWAGFQQHMLGMGYGAGYGGLEGLFSGLTRSIRDALKGLVPPQQTYENINRYLEMLAKTGQILPYDYARRQAMLGATSINPAARLGLPQAQAGAAWSGALGGAAGSPLYYTSLLAATQKATGSTTLNYSNLLKLGKSLGVPISPMSSVQQRALNWAATNLPIATPALLNSFGVPGDLLMRAMLSTIGGATTSKAGRDVWTALTAPHGAGLGTLMKINPAYAGPTLSGKIRQPKWPHLLFPMIAHKMGYSFAIRGTGVSGEPSMPIVPTNLLKEEYAWFLKNSSIMASQLDASAGALHDFVGTVGHATSALQKLVDVLSGMFVGVAVSPWNPTPAHGTGATSVGGAATSGSSRGVPGSSAPPGVPAAPPAVMIR